MRQENAGAKIIRARLLPQTWKSSLRQRDWFRLRGKAATEPVIPVIIATGEAGVWRVTCRDRRVKNAEVR